MKKIIIPEGYETKFDDTGECYECDLNVIVGKGEHEELCCMHHDRIPGCSSNDIVFVKIDRN